MYITTSSSPGLVAVLVSIMFKQKCYDVTFELRTVNCAEKSPKDVAARATYINRDRPV